MSGIRSYTRVTWVVAILAVGSLAGHAADEVSKDRIIGGTRGPTGIMKPLHADDMRAELKSFGNEVNKLAEDVAKVKIDPNAPKDDVEKQFNNSISLARHQADINAIRDRFTYCMTSMEQQAREAEDSGKLTDEEKATLKGCEEHCQQVLDKLNALHHNTGMLASATRQQYFLNAWDEHRKLVDELKALAKDCPMKMDSAMMPMHGKMHQEPAKTPKDETAKQTDKGHEAHH